MLPPQVCDFPCRNCDKSSASVNYSRGIITVDADQKARALDLLKSRGMLRQKDFLSEDIDPETLARLVRDNQILRPARGLYQLPDVAIEASHALVEAAILVPKGIVCLVSALQFHELTLQMPSAVWMAIDRTAWRPTIT